MKRYHQFYLLILLLGFLFPACEGVLKPHQIYKGTIINSHTGKGISGMVVDLYFEGTSDLTQEYPSKVLGKDITNENGAFLISTRWKNVHLLRLHDYQKNYQHLFTFNGAFNFGRIPVRTQIPGVTVVPTYDIELYPITLFTIELRKTSIAPFDSVIGEIDNFYGADCYPCRTQGFSIPGNMTSYKVDGSCFFENVVNIEYVIFTNGVAQSFHKTIECTPGKTTTIDIEF